MVISEIIPAMIYDSNYQLFYHFVHGTARIVTQFITTCFLYHVHQHVLGDETVNLTDRDSAVAKRNKKV